MLARLRFPSLFMLLACVILLCGTAPAHAQNSQAQVLAPAYHNEQQMLTPHGTPSVTTTTTITLVSATLLTPLPLSNSFEVYYTENGQPSTAFAQGPMLTLTTDVGFNVLISTVSTGSTTTERWVLDSQGGNISIASGSAATFYYYDLLMQSAGYATSDGSTPSNPMLQYYTAPTTASSQPSEKLVTLFPTTSAQAIWAVRLSQVSVQSTIVGKPGEQWSLQTSEWTINSVNQVPSPILYYHQYQVTLGYAVKGGGTGYSAPTITCLQYGVPAPTQLSPLTWVDAGPSCSYPLILPGSNQDERWAIPTPTAPVNEAGPVSVTYLPQYLLRITYSIIGGSPNPPTVTGVSFTTSSTVPLSSSPATEWFDSGSSYSISNPLSSSTASERWETAGTTKGAMQSQVNVTDAFYHQFLMTASYSVIGGTSGATAPGLSYMGLGSPTSIQLTGNKQTFWADVGTQYSVPQTLAGSSATERWNAQTTQGTVQASAVLSFSYNHQFFLSVTGGVVSSQWYNSSSTAQISEPGVFGRASGSGQRVTSYSIDGGASTAVKPTAGAVSISILMGAAHTLTINSVQQYQVSLDASATSAISSITAPTITGDNYWYDHGTSVSLVLNGVWGRSAGAGERLLSYSLNGVSKVVSTTGAADVLTAVALNSPETVTTTATAQYRLDTIGGSVATGTIASIPGDTGWYDSGTSVSVSFNYSWNSTSGTRLNALGYSVTGSASVTQIARSGSGTFPVQVTMSRPETITIDSVTQYSLTLSPGQGVSLSLASPTQDPFYDSGTSLTVTTPYTWDIVSNDARQNLVSYTLDSLVTNVTRAGSGSFTTPAILFNGPHTLTFNSVTQDLVNLQFTDASGTSIILPNLVQIQYGDSPITTVPSSGVWLDNGAKFQITNVEWEGADVKPTGQTVYTVDAPANQTVLARVYSGSIKVTDYLGLPISGAKVSVTLANGTIITTTSSKGTVALPEIPLGNYAASISYLGATTTIDGNAALAGAANAKLPLSYPTFVLAVLAVAIVIIIAAVVISPGRRLRNAIPPGEPSQHLTQVCKNCNAIIAVGSLHCPECGAEQV